MCNIGVSECQPSGPDPLGVKVGRHILHMGPGTAQALKASFALGQDASFHGQVSTQVAKPAHLGAREARVGQRFVVSEIEKIFRKGRAAALKPQGKLMRVARLCAKEHAQVGHVSGHGPFNAQLGQEELGAGQIGDAALGGAKAKNILPSRWVSKGAHEVRAVCDGQHSEGQGTCCAATAAAGRALRVVSIGGGAKQGIEGV